MAGRAILGYTVNTDPIISGLSHCFSQPVRRGACKGAPFADVFLRGVLDSRTTLRDGP